MIVPMKKVSLVVTNRDLEIALERLKDSGVMHLRKKNVSSGLMDKLLERQAKCRWALTYLTRYNIKNKVPVPKLRDDPPVDMAAHIKGLVAEKDVLFDQLAHYAGEKRRVSHWGDFDPHDFQFLATHGIKLFLYYLPRVIYNRIGKETKIIVLKADKQWVKCVSLGAEIPGIPHFKLPAMSLSAMNERINVINRRIGNIEAELSEIASHNEIVKSEYNLIQEEIEIETAKIGIDTLKDVPEENTISWFSGFVPGDKIDVVKNVAIENSWVLVWDDPTPRDLPPTLLRNKPAVRIIQPLFSLLGTIPGYWEYDISLSYMVFYCFFFAMIMADAGYGILILAMGIAIGLFLKKKKPSFNGVFPDAAKLVILLASCTIVWGCITGAWFGVPPQNLPYALRLLIIQPFNNIGPLQEFPSFLSGLFILPPELPNNVQKTNWNIQFFCFTLGAIQIIWARSKNAMRALPQLAAIGQLGWMVIISGVYFLVLSLMLKMTLPSFAIWLITGGAILLLIFGEQTGGNFLKNIGKSCANFFTIFLKVVGSFADIVSYIRLFAVGLAGAMIAATFNSLAIPAGGLGGFGLGFIIRLIAVVLILVAGHTLNLLMTSLSLIVHGVRLNLLEYAGNHLNMGWTGYAYKPFASRQKEIKN